jgi:hypothetical protein
MACILYREGKGAVEHGIPCESTTCEVETLEAMIEAGWSVNPPGYEPPKLEGVEDEQEDAPAIHPVRLAAKEAGVEGWDFKRIGTLEKLLSEK